MQDDSSIGPQAYFPLALGAGVGALLGAVVGGLLGGMLDWGWLPQLGAGTGGALGVLAGSRLAARRAERRDQ